MEARFLFNGRHFSAQIALRRRECAGSTRCSKELLLRAEDVQVLPGFDSGANASACLRSDMFNLDVA